MENTLVQLATGQCWFGFVSLPGAGGCQPSRVKSLRRFNQEIVQERSTSWAWGELAEWGETGRVRSTTLNHWLEFYTPLSSRGN